MIAVYDKDLKDLLYVALRFENGGLLMSDGHYVSQQPDGKRHFDAPSVGPWERCIPNGQLLAFNVGRPWLYTWVEVPE